MGAGSLDGAGSLLGAGSDDGGGEDEPESVGEGVYDPEVGTPAPEGSPTDGGVPDGEGGGVPTPGGREPA